MTNKEKVIDDTSLEWYGLTEEEIKEMEKGKMYTSEEVDKILYLRDLFARVWIYVDDFDKFEQILEGLEMYNEMKNELQKI